MSSTSTRRSTVRLAIAVVSILAVSAPVAVADRQGPPEPHPGNANPGTGNPHEGKGPERAHPGQGNAYARRGKPQPAAPRKSQGKSNRGVRAHGAPSKAKQGDRRGAAKRGTAPRSEHARAGKTTICHATGSATNPFVRITVSNNALPAHRRHHDGRDVIPAGDNCGAAQAATRGRGASGVADQAASGLQQAASTPAAAPRSAPPAAGGGPLPAGAKAPAGDAQQVLGVQESNAPDAGSQPASAVRSLDAADNSNDEGSLPFTGGDLIALAIAGAVALLAGVSLRRALRGRATLGG